MGKLDLFDNFESCLIIVDEDKGSEEEIESGLQHPEAVAPSRSRHDSPDISPSRRSRHDSPDVSPPRRSRHDSPDLSPKRQHSGKSGKVQNKGE